MKSGLYWDYLQRENSATSRNLHNYKAMNNLSVKTIVAIDTGNYTAWTLLTSCIMENGSLLVAGRITEKSTLRQSNNALILLDNLQYWGFSHFVSISVFHRL